MHLARWDIMGQAMWRYNRHDGRSQRNAIYGVHQGEAIKMHCIIHQEALCAKTVQLGDVIIIVVITVNIFRAQGLHHREFKAFLSDVDAKYGKFLYHSDVCWLSHGSVLQRFYSLQLEIDHFLKKKDQSLHKLSDHLW